VLVYYRKPIIQKIFKDQSSLFSFSLIGAAYAQEGVLKPHSLLESQVRIGEVVFRFETGLIGMRITSSFDIDELTCEHFKDEVYQLGLLLYPVDIFNEKFLIKIRDCTIKLDHQHPVKKWLNFLSSSHQSRTQDQVKISFLTEVLNTQFNLVTDQKMKKAIIAILQEIDGRSNYEKILKSYLLLMIGNIAKSDNILREIIHTNPRNNYQNFRSNFTMFEKLAEVHLDKIIRKMARHPADRSSFELFGLYCKLYFNDPDLKLVIQNIQLDNLHERIGLSYTKKIAPQVINYQKLLEEEESKRIDQLKKETIPLDEQAYWIWPFINFEALISDKVADYLLDMNKKDPLWTTYLLQNEKLIDLYFKKGGIPAARKRQFLRDHLQKKEDFMLTLYKLIELGDIDAELVKKTVHYLTNE
jgi:hypothetical protein